MDGLKIGHVSLPDKGTGVSVFLFERPTRGSYLLCGAGPASHELAPLDPETSIGSVHGLMLSGGSAFGLYAAKGVMDFLAEKQIGLPLPHGVIPIVPAAAIYDLVYKTANVPSEGDAYQSCLVASESNSESGRIGAGTGATIGKIVTDAFRATAGLGRSEIRFDNGLHVVVYTVVNAIGDVYDAKNNIIAGARLKNGEFANCEKFLLANDEKDYRFRNADSASKSDRDSRSNTTLAAVFTNAHFSKTELRRLAKMAIAGMARAIKPVFTCYDGDIVFCFSLGDIKVPLLQVGTIAAELIRLSILDAVKESEVVK